ncbi:hypothetical protein HanIR_Chr12g0571871 [Helianthus annuus]|nr:hypothetical protein HanIR_Chr12g0571871 [Helianthus annuus]
MKVLGQRWRFDGDFSGGSTVIFQVVRRRVSGGATASLVEVMAEMVGFRWVSMVGFRWCNGVSRGSMVGFKGEFDGVSRVLMVGFRWCDGEFGGGGGGDVVVVEMWLWRVVCVLKERRGEKRWAYVCVGKR